MTLATRLSDLTTRIATECKSIRTLMNGNALDLSGLNTTAKSNLVAALNEIKSNLDTLAAAGSALIDDNSTSNSSTWSSTKIASGIAAKTEISDAATSPTSTWSSDKITTAISASTAGLASINDGSISSTTAAWSAYKSATEVAGLQNNIDAKASIDDATTALATTWSSTKITTAIDAAVAASSGGVEVDDASISTTNTWSSSKIDSELSTKAVINDIATVSTTETWSISRISDSIEEAITALTNGAPAALDTLKELADAIGDDGNFAATISTALGYRVRFDEAQTLTAGQKAQAKANIDAYGSLEIGDPDTDFVSIFNTGL